MFARLDNTIPFALVAFTALCAPSFAGEKPSPAEEKILEELKALRKIIEKLEKRVAALEKELRSESSRPSIPIPPPWERSPFRNRTAKSMKGIDLPQSPSKEQVREYVRKIKAISRGRNSWSSTDPQVSMLKRVGPEHVDVLIEELGSFDHGPNNSYLIGAIVDLACARHLPLILKNLCLHRDLVKAVVSNGWEREARDILVGELESGTAHLPEDWIRAVSNLENPADYPLLLEYFGNAQNPHMIYPLVGSLPGLSPADLDTAVATAWKNAKRGGSRFGSRNFRKDGMARIAAEHGHLDGLELIVGLLDTAGGSNWSVHMNLRGTVLKLIPFRGTNAQIRTWFEDYGKKLQFDRSSGKYEFPSKEGDPEKEGSPEEEEGF